MNHPGPAASGADPRGGVRIAAGAAVLLAAIPLAAAAGKLSRAGVAPERAVQLTGLGFAAVLATVCLSYTLTRRGRLRPGALAFVALSTTVVLAVTGYFLWAAGQIGYRADILIWSESPFVNDIIKFRAGIPLYGAPADLNSFFYTPGSQLLTYALAKLLGGATSIPTYRLIQLVYVSVAALLGGYGVRRLRLLAGAARDTTLWWELLWIPLLFLGATNALTNPFSHLLHNDALTLLVSTLAFVLLLEYALHRSVRVLALMAVVPLLGFAVKQSTAIWLVLYLGYLAVFDRPRSIRRVLLFGLTGTALLAAGYATGRALWGAAFPYWVVTVMGNHTPSILRGLEHALDTWMFWLAGVGAGLLLLRPVNTSRLLGPWLVWFLLIATEAYTSGIAWMVNHLGPGSMIATVWLCAALPEIWPDGEGDRESRSPMGWLQAVGASVAALFGLAGLQMIRVPMPGLPPDAQRYAAAIEAEFAGEPADRILLDHGSWPYLAAGIAMRDRSSVVGELGVTETGDFSGLYLRLRERYYRRILLRDLNTRDFSYDHGIWRTSSGIRDSLQRYYRVVRLIPRVAGTQNDPIGLREISVLEPRSP